MSVDTTLLVDTKTSQDPNMAALLTLTDRFLLENEVCPDLCDVTEEDVELWVKKSVDLDVSTPSLGYQPLQSSTFSRGIRCHPIHTMGSPSD